MSLSLLYKYENQGLRGYLTCQRSPSTVWPGWDSHPGDHSTCIGGRHGGRDILLAGQIHPFLVFPISIFILPSHLPSSSSMSMNLFFFFNPCSFYEHKVTFSYIPLGVLIHPFLKLTSKWMTVHLCVDPPEMTLLHLLSVICMMKTIGDCSQI